MSGEYAGTVLNVSAAPLGDVLAADAASGATTLYVTDTSDFDPAEGGFLSINGETIQYTAVDDDAETITLVSGISADATADDPVYVWDVGLAEIAKEYRALVAVPGALGNDDAIDALVAQSLAPLLPEGLRDPGTGESVVLEQQGTDWIITDVRGKKPQIQPGFTNVTTGDSSGPDSTSITSTETGAGSSQAVGDSSIAIGPSAEATVDNDIAIGASAAASGGRGVAIGSTAFSQGDASVGVGFDCTAAADNSIAVGKSAEATGIGSVAIGCDHLDHEASASGTDSIAIGGRTGANGSETTALGHFASTGSQAGGTALGANSTASGLDSVAVGYAPITAEDHCIAIGSSAQANRKYGIALGASSGAGGLSGSDHAIAVGRQASATKLDSIALGRSVIAGGVGSVAIGRDSSGTSASTSTDDEIVLGTANHTVNIPGSLVVDGTPITGGGGGVASVTGDETTIHVDNTDPANPVISALGGGGGGGGGILACTAYAPSTLATYTNSGSTTLADVDATNLAVTFTAPASGNVKVTLAALTDCAGTGSHNERWALRESSTLVAGSICQVSNSQNGLRYTVYEWVVTGLTAGSSHTYKWAWKVNAGGTTAHIYAGGSGDGNECGAAVMTVYELP